MEYSGVSSGAERLISHLSYPGWDGGTGALIEMVDLGDGMEDMVLGVEEVPSVMCHKWAA